MLKKKPVRLFKKKRTPSISTTVDTWMKHSGRFAFSNDPNPVYFLKGIPINVISRHIYNYKNYSDIESVWEQWKKPKFEEGKEYVAVKKWLFESVLPFVSEETKNTLLSSQLADSLRNKTVRASVSLGLLPQPPIDYYDFKQAQHNHNTRWQITKKEIEDVVKYAREYRARKKLLVFYMLRDLGFKILSIVEAQKTHSCYFYIEGLKKPVRLSEHFSKNRDCSCCTLLLNKSNEAILNEIKKSCMSTNKPA